MSTFGRVARQNLLPVVALLLFGGGPVQAGEKRSLPPAPAQAVLVEIIEQGVPAASSWPEVMGPVSETYEETAFGLFHVPWRYTGTGVRTDRGNPFLLRLTGDVEIPAGSHRLLVRSRSAARLTIDGTTVAETPFAKPMGDGHNALRKPVLELGQTRFVSPGNRESLVNFDSPGGKRRIVLEVIVGGVEGKKRLRPETGELLVAIAADGSDEFRLLAPSRVVPLTDEGWTAYAAERAAFYSQVEADRRQRARQRFSLEIARRHDEAREWVLQHPAPAVPRSGDADNPGNEIDAFLAQTFAVAREAASIERGVTRFHRDVQPLFSQHCVSCHGKKAIGGLRLDSRAGLLAGGNSTEAAIVPGNSKESPLLQRVRSSHLADRMPPKGDRLTKPQTELLERWIDEGANWPESEPAPVIQFTRTTDDLTFLRRLFLDVVGVPPTLEEIEEFRAEEPHGKRQRWIDRLLIDPRWADVWTPKWQDWCGENPNLVNATLNNTGPFRYWLHESFLDNKPMDLFVRELVMMEGSLYGGGPAGFGLAAQNDAPYAAKAGVIASAFLGVEMKCARCHDAPFHDSTQRQLFELAGMLAREPIKLPGTSTVPRPAGGETRVSLIKSTLSPGEEIRPAWPFSAEYSVLKGSHAAADTRHQLADFLTAPENERFAQVMVNRVWHHFLGCGLVEPLNDWERAKPSHPELLTWLSRQFVANGYDLKFIARIILNSAAYQREASTDPAAVRWYTAPSRRRLSAELVVDSLFSSYGVEMEVGDICIDLDGGRSPDNGLNLGRPKRAWEFAYTSNDRDRPSLNLPRVRAITEVLGAFGWPEIRQEAISDRKASPEVTQAALLQNGAMSRWLTRLSDQSQLTELVSRANSPESLVRQIYLRILTREPTTEELADGIALLAPGFAERHVAIAESPAVPKRYEPYVAWSNHLDPESTVQRQKEETEARKGPPPTSRLDADWRERCEDLLWTLLNSPEMVYVP